MFSHADGLHDAVELEYKVEQQDLEDSRADAGHGAGQAGGILVGIDSVMDLARRFPNQEKAARDQDHVLPRESMAEDLEDRIGQRHYPGDDRQQQKPEQKRAAQPDDPGAVPMLARQPVRQDRDEDEIVDPEDDLEHDQRDKRGPGLGAEQKSGNV